MVIWVVIMTWVALYGRVIPPAQETATHLVQPGDTWPALAFRYGLEEDALRVANPQFNRRRQPAIGATVTLPPSSVERSGTLIRVGNGGLLQTAARYALSPWAIATQNRLESPYSPTFFRPLLLPGDGIIRDLPPEIDSLELSLVPAQPGVALGVRGTLTVEAAGTESLNGALDGLPLAMTTQADRFVGVVGTGAFYAGGNPELWLQVGSAPPWIQPWTFAEREWEYQDLTLTGEAAAIDQQARDEERARLRELWANVTSPRWTTAFQTPIADFLEVSANYGARRSYNGGPYLTYHEGVDFSAYAGTPVYAPAAGTVVLAERLYVRGGAVIIDHGLGIFSGYYHLSAVHAQVGQEVAPGDLLGEVGTTGLSTGNHLHWDLLVNSIWVDAAAWQQQGLACWLLEGLGQACAAPAG
jgi:murein DD-endopeptidase MepM/ murein hydrolase activator NlpD